MLIPYCLENFIIVNKMEKAVPLNAMIVEDEAELCFLLSILLIQKNLNPSCAYTIAEAKQIIKRINPSVLFVDNRLPDGYGIDFISQVKKDFPETKIIMMTAYNSSQDIQSAIRKGADYFISKPFNSAIIKNTIDLLHLGKTG